MHLNTFFTSSLAMTVIFANAISAQSPDFPQVVVYGGSPNCDPKNTVDIGPLVCQDVSTYYPVIPSCGEFFAPGGVQFENQNSQGPTYFLIQLFSDTECQNFITSEKLNPSQPGCQTVEPLEGHSIGSIQCIAGNTSFT